MMDYIPDYTEQYDAYERRQEAFSRRMRYVEEDEDFIDGAIEEERFARKECER